MNQIEAYSWIP